MDINENIFGFDTSVTNKETLFHDNWVRLTPKLSLLTEKAVVRANKASFSCFMDVVHNSYCNLAFEL